MAETYEQYKVRLIKESQRKITESQAEPTLISFSAIGCHMWLTSPKSELWKQPSAFEMLTWQNIPQAGLYEYKFVSFVYLGEDGRIMSHQKRSSLPANVDKVYRLYSYDCYVYCVPCPNYVLTDGFRYANIGNLNSQFLYNDPHCINAIDECIVVKSKKDFDRSKEYTPTFESLNTFPEEPQICKFTITSPMVGVHEIEVISPYFEKPETVKFYDSSLRSLYEQLKTHFGE